MTDVKEKFEDTGGSRIRMNIPTGGHIDTQSVEAHLLFEILNVLTDIRDGIYEIDKNTTP